MTAPPPVIVRVPPDLGEMEVCVRHELDGVKVDARPRSSRQAWKPVDHLGGGFEVRDR